MAPEVQTEPPTEVLTEAPVEVQTEPVTEAAVEVQVEGVDGTVQLNEVEIKSDDSQVSNVKLFFKISISTLPVSPGRTDFI